jgi:hypothetical protein
MRKVFLLILALAFLLSVSAMAQVSPRHKSSTTTTTTTTSTTTSVTGPEHSIEGCIAKESTDYFLVPRRGEPFQLQANESRDLGALEGHRVKVTGKEVPARATSQSANEEAGSVAAQQSSGTGNDLHRLANRQLVVDQVRSISQTCPVNWNPATSSRRR